MVMMFVGGVLLMFDGFLILFLPYNIYGAGVFCSRPNPYRGLAVNNQQWQEALMEYRESGGGGD